MSGASLVQLIAACIGVVGSLFFAVGVMRQSVEAMARLSSSYWDWNPHLPPALAAQKADYLFGGGLIVLAFAVQLASFFFPSDVSVLTESQTRAAPVVAMVCAFAAFVLLRRVSARTAKRYEVQIESWLKSRNASPRT
jgi:hypothetical protein